MRITKRKKISIASSKSSHSITLYYQKIPQERFNALNDDEKYSFLVLGHVHDEISWLQRMAYAASRYSYSSSPKKSDLETSAQTMQATFLTRLLFGKLREFEVLLDDSTILKDFIKQYFNPEDRSCGEMQIKAIAEAFEKNSWIRTARNKHFLHYPRRNDIEEILNGGIVNWEVKVFHGKKSANTFYPTSDAMANLAWFRLVCPDDPMKGLDIALSELGNIAQLSLKALEISIGHFINEKLMQFSDNQEVSLTVSETIDSLRLPYFVKA